MMMSREDEAPEARAESSPLSHRALSAVLQKVALDMEQAPWFPKLRLAILDKAEDVYGQQCRRERRGRHSGHKRSKGWARTVQAASMEQR
jgi:hypothetical protein